MLYPGHEEANGKKGAAARRCCGRLDHSAELAPLHGAGSRHLGQAVRAAKRIVARPRKRGVFARAGHASPFQAGYRSEEHTSELQSLMRISYAVFCLK